MEKTKNKHARVTEKSHGWVVRTNDTKRFVRAPHEVVERINHKLKTRVGVINHYSHYGTEQLCSAHVFPTRKLAREEKSPHEHIKKVIVYENKAIEILAGR